MKLRLLIISLFFASMELALGQPYNDVVWEKKTGPTGGEIVDIEYDAANSKYYAIAGSSRRLFVSSDNGDNWTEKNRLWLVQLLQ